SIFNRASAASPAEQPASNQLASGYSQVSNVPSQNTSTQSGSYPQPPASLFPPVSSPSPYAYSEKPAEVEPTEIDEEETEYAAEGYQDEEGGAVLEEEQVDYD